jgi:hypothetical protein
MFSLLLLAKKISESCDLHGHVTFLKVVDNISKVPEMEKSCDQLLSLSRKMQNTKILRLNAE